MKFKKAISAALASLLTFGALSLSAGAQTTAAYKEIRSYEAASVPAPKVSLSSGSYMVKEGLRITVTPTSYTDEIWYSTNGTGFRRSSKNPFTLTITKNTVLRLYTVRNGQRSKTETVTYNLVPDVTSSLKPGVHYGAQRVFVSSPVKDVKLYYTLDGSIPTELSAPYSPQTGILLKKSCCLKVAAIKSGWNKKVASFTYAIIGGQDTPDDPLDEGGLIQPEYTGTQSDSKLADYKSKWHYNQLTAIQKTAYEKIYNAAAGHLSNVSISNIKIKTDDFKKAYWAFDYDNPQFLANGSGYSITYYQSNNTVASFSILYSRSEKQISAVETSFKNIANNVVKEADKKIGDYERVKYIHDWIINHTKYNKTAGVYVSEADGAVVYGKALCEGYSKAFMYLAQELGYDCICVIGDVGSEGHMWNMIKIGGQWYHVDVTHDDPIMSDGSDGLFYDYFLVSTNEIKKTRTIDGLLKIPNAPRSY